MPNSPEFTPQPLSPSADVPSLAYISTTRTFDGRRLGALLSTARSHLGIALSEVADRAGVHKSVVSRLERGTIVAPSFGVVAKLAFVLGLSLDEISAHVGLPRLRLTLDPPANLEISDVRLRGALLSLAQANDPVWVNQTINAITAIAAR